MKHHGVRLAFFLCAGASLAADVAVLTAPVRSYARTNCLAVPTGNIASEFGREF
jgi:hypothetical protein